MQDSWKNSINQQRIELSILLSCPLEKLAKDCARVWGDREQLNEVLTRGFSSVPHCTYLYVLRSDGTQISDNVSQSGLLTEHFARDRSNRPYMKEAVPAAGFLLSDAYISLRNSRPSLTALQIVRKNNEMLGFLGADFDLRDLPMTTKLYEESAYWRQIKGDPAIRSTVFQQIRTESQIDINRQQAFSILEELLTNRGMFQGVIHFSSSRATVWVIDDPYRYRILDSEALNDADICLAYPLHDYPQDAVIPQQCIKPILESMQKLRMADETIYLRSASINIFNGLISLTFSCDGTHYMPFNEFLQKDALFWGGDTG